ncbi:hypothetical protein ElyMa_000198800 [Elysia marginata]|uniref:Uncharacterized protein n=1 Tax=Elysia marginata TaxID=1093978 RepID=A0AAV4EXL7_9GAST|nr:hypothetical protein ElyMa_000198800 [Elysia marginata]
MYCNFDSEEKAVVNTKGGQSDVTVTINNGGNTFPYWRRCASGFEENFIQPMNVLGFRCTRMGFNVRRMQVAPSPLDLTSDHKVPMAPQKSTQLWVFTDINRDYGVPQLHQDGSTPSVCQEDTVVPKTHEDQFVTCPEEPSAIVISYEAPRTKYQVMLPTPVKEGGLIYTSSDTDCPMAFDTINHYVTDDFGYTGDMVFVHKNITKETGTLIFYNATFDDKPVYLMTVKNPIMYKGANIISTIDVDMTDQLVTHRKRGNLYVRTITGMNTVPKQPSTIQNIFTDVGIQDLDNFFFMLANLPLSNKPIYRKFLND